MKLTINKISDNIEVIPSIYKDMEKPPKFIFRTPNSSDMLKFLWGGNAVDEAIFNCFLNFENKIELQDIEGKPIEYNNYEQFVKIGLSDEIALIHAECRAIFEETLAKMLKEAKETEKK